MADFRRWILALAVLALFAGLASAQTNTGAGGSTLTCNANVTSQPQLRQEGLTELIGDIIITCTGGNATDGASTFPGVNITVQLTSPITTRLDNSSSVSEAMLLIDEPNTTGTAANPTPGPVPAFGSNAGFVPCPTPLSGCVAYGYHVNVGGTVYIIETSAPATVAPATTGTTQGANLFQGVVNGNQVTFFGVPVIAPGSNGARDYRITGIRTNASAFSSGAPVQAFIQTSNSVALPISNAQPIVGFVQTSLTTSVTSPAGFAQCVSQTLAPAGILTFSEANNFAAAFKTRVDPAVNGQNGQAAAVVQNVPGTLYRSETGFTPGALTGLASTKVGLADFGTRFKAVFTNLPAGAKVYVSTTNVAVSTGAATGDAPPSPAYAIYVGPVDSVGEVTSLTVPSSVSGGPGASIPLVEIDTAGSTTATAVWEVITTQQNVIDSYQFAVYVSYTAAPGTNSPAIGSASVNLSYAPISTVTTATQGDPIPRFLDTSKPATAFTIAACQTVLLFPFLTNLGGFDTGIAIANTSSDPFGTVPQAGTCKLNWYGAASPAVTTTPNVPTATVYTNLVSVAAPAFEGYMIAQCAFQYAHGFAFISDVGARQLAMGYLALVIPDPSLRTPVGSRPPSPFPTGAATSGEQLGQ